MSQAKEQERLEPKRHKPRLEDHKRYVRLKFKHCAPVIVEPDEAAEIIANEEEGTLMDRRSVWMAPSDYEALPEWNP